ncbi:MAG: SGNH/GDSL hydrolase family protein [Pseudolabrys sp.]
MRQLLRFDYLIAVGLAALAVVISPYGIRILSGRVELSFRISLISLVIDGLLILFIAALLTRGRLRRTFFWLILLLFPLAIVCGLEAFAHVVRFADTVAPLADMSVFRNRERYPAYFRSDIRSIAQEQDGVLLYRPWRGEDVAINALGLRAMLPTSKRPGEWRIAVTGGSAAWGFGVLDADTIPAQLENILRRGGHGNMSVYNFGIGGREIQHELALLKKFRDVYAIDQVVFYTGGNDVVYSYMRQFSPSEDTFQLDTWELVKTAQRVHAQLFPTSKGMLDRLDADILPRLRKVNPLRVGILAADDYCHRTGLRCDFVLQPMLATRRTASGKELEMQKTLLGLYPRLDVAAIQMYADAMALNPSHAVHDFSGMFDQTTEHFYADPIHVNEAGNHTVAEHLASTILFGSN